MKLDIKKCGNIMKIKVRTKVLGFDVVIEHRSTTILNWIYFLEFGYVFKENKFELHKYFIKNQENELLNSNNVNVYYLDRNVIERFRDGYASFVYRHMDTKPNINEFIKNLDYYKSLNPKFFNIYLDILDTKEYTKIYDYDEIESVRDLFEHLYNKKIHDDIRYIHSNPHGDETSVFAELRNQEISEENIQYLIDYYS